MAEHTKLHVDTSYVYRGTAQGHRRILDAHGAVVADIHEAIDGETAERLVTCWNAFEGADTEHIAAVGHIPSVIESMGAHAAVAGGQWMKLCALLMHRWALKGETVVITAEEMARLDELYPEGAELQADDGENGSITLTLLPPGEQPSGIIVVEGGGPGRIVT